jgi:phage tail sheath gpL-like
MSIGFLTIPSILLNAPGSFAEFDSSQTGGGLVGAPHDCLVVGQMLSSGSAETGVIQEGIDSVDDGRQLFGRGSHASQLVEAFKANNPQARLYAIGLSDATSSAAATGAFNFDGNATETRELALYISGRRIAVAILNGDTAAVISAKVLEALNGADALIGFVTADDGSEVGPPAITGVSIQAGHFGSIGNQIQLGHSQNAGERVAAGVTITVVPMAGGAIDPSYTPAIAAIADAQYATIALGTSLPTPVGLFTALLSQRWEGMSDRDGHLFACAADSRANLSTAGQSFNTEQLTLVGVEKSAKCQTPWEECAAVAALNAAQVVVDPALHQRGVALDGYSGPRRGAAFTYDQRNQILGDGVSTLFTGPDGSLRIDRLVTTYKLNAQGYIDKAYQDLTVKRTLSFLRYSMLARVSSKFGRMKLKDDGDPIPPGQMIVNPSIIKGELIALFGEWEDAGLVDNANSFVASLQVVRNSSDRNRVDALLSPEIIRNLLVFAARIAFR